MDIAWCIFVISVGLAAGVAGGFLGICGCVIMFPILTLVLRYPIDIAVGTNVTAAIFTAVSGTIAHVRLRNVRFDVALPVLVGGVIGAVLGSLIFNIVRAYGWLLYILASSMFLYIVARLTLDVLGVARQRQVPASSLTLRVLVGLLAGIVTGLLGFGGGYVMVPSFFYLLGLPSSIAVGTSLTSYTAMLVTSSVFKLTEHSANVATALLLGAGTATGAQIGARLVNITPARILKLVFALVLLYVAVSLLYKGLNLIHVM